MKHAGVIESVIRLVAKSVLGKVVFIDRLLIKLLLRIFEYSATTDIVTQGYSDTTDIATPQSLLVCTVKLA